MAVHAPPSVAGVQLQLHGGQGWPGMHAGHAHAQPVPPPPLPPLPLVDDGPRWQTPLRQLPPPSALTGHARPNPYQVQESAESALHVVAVVKALHGSAGALPEDELPPAPQLHAQGGQGWPGMHAGHPQVQVPPPPPDALPPDAVPVPDAALPAEALPPPMDGGVLPGDAQAQSHAGQVSPGAHTGQLQVHVLPPVHVGGGAPLLLPTGGVLHAQSHGGQVSPGAHVAQAQVHVPPPPPPMVPPPLQLHSQDGQELPTGQSRGHAQSHAAAAAE